MAQRFDPPSKVLPGVNLRAEFNPLSPVDSCQVEMGKLMRGRRYIS